MKKMLRSRGMGLPYSGSENLVKVFDGRVTSTAIREFLGPYYSLPLRHVFGYSIPSWPFSITEEEWYPFSLNSLRRDGRDVFLRVPVVVEDNQGMMEDRYDEVTVEDGRVLRAIRCTAYDVMMDPYYGDHIVDPRGLTFDFRISFDSDMCVRSSTVMRMKSFLATFPGRRSIILNSKQMTDPSPQATHFIYVPLLFVNMGNIYKGEGICCPIRELVYMHLDQYLYRCSPRFSFWYCNMTTYPLLGTAEKALMKYEWEGEILLLHEVLWSGGEVKAARECMRILEGGFVPGEVIKKFYQDHLDEMEEVEPWYLFRSGCVKLEDIPKSPKNAPQAIDHRQYDIAAFFIGRGDSKTFASIVDGLYGNMMTLKDFLFIHERLPLLAGEVKFIRDNIYVATAPYLDSKDVFVVMRSMDRQNPVERWKESPPRRVSHLHESRAICEYDVIDYIVRGFGVAHLFPSISNHVFQDEIKESGKHNIRDIDQMFDNVENIICALGDETEITHPKYQRSAMELIVAAVRELINIRTLLRRLGDERDLDNGNLHLFTHIYRFGGLLPGIFKDTEHSSILLILKYMRENWGVRLVSWNKWLSLFDVTYLT